MILSHLSEHIEKKYILILDYLKIPIVVAIIIACLIFTFEYECTLIFDGRQLIRHSDKSFLRLTPTRFVIIIFPDKLGMHEICKIRTPTACYSCKSNNDELMTLLVHLINWNIIHYSLILSLTFVPTGGIAPQCRCIHLSSRI